MLKYAYHLGARLALRKLGTEAGPIAYAPSADRSTISDKNMQLTWLDADREPATTGEESGIGMPSAPPKTAGMADGGYSQFSDGEYGSGSVDANKDKVDAEQRKSNSVDRAFTVNQNIDSSTGPEPATTFPHGSKYASALKAAALGSAMGMGGSLRSAGLGSSKSMMGTGGLGNTGIAAPKPMVARDPRVDKPPGMNLQQGVQTASAISDMGTSIGSRFRRMDGNPM